jgi:TonB family protein
MPLLAHPHEASRSPAPRELSYGELVARASIVSVTTTGEAYAHRLYREGSRLGEPAQRVCGVGAAGRSPHTFTLAAFVRSNGSLGNVRVAPEDALTRCFAAQMQVARWPTPPGDAGTVTAVRFDGLTGELLSVLGAASPGTQTPPPGPSTASFAIYGPQPLPSQGLAGSCRSVVEVTPGPGGAVRTAVVVQSCNQPAADAAALDAARQWVIALPPAARGSATKRRVRVPFAF